MEDTNKLSMTIGIISLCIFLFMISTYNALAIDDNTLETLKQGVVKISAYKTGAGIIIGIKNKKTIYILK